ncbi:MAG: hypothetical protein Q9160_006579 [Pyrenula sp. 1 TL-2023]
MPSPRDPPSPEYSNLDCAFPPFPTSRSATPRTGTPVKELKPLDSEFNNDYVREHAEPFNASSGPSQDGSSRLGHSRGRSVTSQRSRSGSVFGGRDTSLTRPSTANSHRRRPSLASISGGPKASLRSQPPVPSLPPKEDLPPMPNLDAFSASPVMGRLPFCQRADQNLDNGASPNERSGGYGGLDDREPTSTTSNLYNPYNFETTSLRGQNAIRNLSASSTTYQSNQDSELFLPSTQKFPASETSRRPPPLNEKPFLRNSAERPTPSPTRSQTYPIHNDDRDSVGSLNKALPRRPSEPSPVRYRHRQSRSEIDLEPDRLSRRDKLFSSRDDTNNHRPTNDFFPPRSSSRKRRPSNLRPEAAPPLPNLALDFDMGNPYHTPSESSSSHASSISTGQTGSSRSSPPPPDEHRRKRSGTLERNTVDSDYPPPLRLKPFGPPDSPTDPLMQAGRLSPLPRLNYNKTMKSNAPSMVSDASSSSRPRRNPTSASKGICRGCNLPITGKSISSADGRLTGRYHKECFVCKTCQEPFQTTDFYVHDNLPYCGQHYHALNGSICGTCGNGIEGQYLEAMVNSSKGKEKFHPNCFTCCTCRILLDADYYELNGKIYCERDAFRAVPSAGPTGHNRGLSIDGPNGGRTPGRAGANSRMPPGHGKLLGIANGIGGRTMSGRNRFPERRTTKLMMMGNPI